jgi:hypothetical protein
VRRSRIWVKESRLISIGVGVGVGAFVACTILAIACIIWARHRSERSRRREEEFRARLESEYQARLMQNQEYHGQKSELSGAVNIFEIDQGWPSQLPMLECREIGSNPMTVSGEGGRMEIGTSE